MSDEEPEDRESSASAETSLLFIWERLIAALLGAGGVFFGGLAVFTTSNQAGSAVLLLVSAAFLLIGIQGTPLTKLTSGSNTVQLEKRRIVRRLKIAAREADDSKTSKVYEDAASIVQSPAWSASGSIAVSGRKFEHRIHEAFQRIGVNALPMSRSDSSADFIVGDNETRVAVVVKYRRHVLGMRDVDESLGMVTRTGLPLLIVTNAPLSSKVQEFNSTWGDRRPRVEIITWHSEASDELLRRAWIRTSQT